jgi:hypothetical protein
MTEISDEQSREELRLTGNKRLELMDAVVNLYGLKDLSMTHGAGHSASGFRIRLTVWPDQQAYIYVLPWSRGWSVHTSHLPNDPNRDHVLPAYKGLCKPVHNPRNKIGPWHTDTHKVLDEVNNQVTKLRKLGQARRVRHMQKHWPAYLAATMNKVFGNPASAAFYERFLKSAG